MPQKYGYMANEESFEQKPCLICHDKRPTYSWTDLSGEAYCMRCGTPYQLKWGVLQEGEVYPRINVLKSSIPLLQRYYQETGKSNGQGSFFVGSDYRDQLEAREEFFAWCEKNKDILQDVFDKMKLERNSENV